MEKSFLKGSGISCKIVPSPPLPPNNKLKPEAIEKMMLRRMRIMSA
jgi:hypothetical protein